MSLVALGIRIAAVRAIRAAIWPGFTVADSPQAPTDLLEAGKPLIAVYTGHDTGKVDGRDLFGGDPQVALTMQVFLPATFAITVGGAPLTLDTRAEGAETLLDVVSRRITGAFLGQAEPWSQMMFRLIDKMGRSANASYLVQSEKVRTSAREITIDCSVIHEPIPGAPPADVWAELVALMQAEPAGPGSVAPLAAWIAAEISGPATLTQADRDRIDLGLSVYAAERVGILPTVHSINAEPGAPAAVVVPCDPDAPAPNGYVITP